MKYLSICMALILSFCHCCAEESKTYQLDNGLKVIIRPVTSAGVVAMVWYRVGASDEPGGLTGISHALEHMMFKGTKNYPPNSYSKIIAGIGGQENAMTTRDYTVYFAKLSAKHLPTFLQLEADRMQHLTLDAGEFAKEIKVVREERRMRTDDNPQASTYEKLMAVTHIASPYHHPVVGWMDDLQNMKIADLKQWYNTWYQPNNATIVIVGHVNPDKTYQLVKRYFKKIKSKVLPKRKPQREIAEPGFRTLALYRNAKLPLIALSYNTPSMTSSQNKQDAYALEVLAYVLDGGSSARFSRYLIRGEHLASQMSASYDLYARFASSFMVFAIPNQKTSIEQLKEATIKQINLLKTTRVSAKELQRIKNQLIASKTFEKDSLFGQALEIGILDSSNLSQQVGSDYIKQIESITPEMLMAVANRYFTDSRMSVVILRAFTKRKPV